MWHVYIYICICIEDATLLEILLNNLKVSQSKLLQGNKIIAGSAGINSFQHESSIPGSFFFWRIQGKGTLRSFFSLCVCVMFVLDCNGFIRICSSMMLLYVICSSMMLLYVIVIF